ncbi:MAG: hypothetical protein WCW44_02025 [archaeon]|jgi:hypothetical protein
MWVEVGLHDNIRAVSFQTTLKWSEEGKVLFVDAGNGFNPYYFSKAEPSKAKEVLSNIFVSRAFTIYQLRQLILEIESAFIETGAKSLVVSDLTSGFTEEDIGADERHAILRHIRNKLVTLKCQNVLVTLNASCRSWNESFLEGLEWGERLQVTE